MPKVSKTSIPRGGKQLRKSDDLDDGEKRHKSPIRRPANVSLEDMNAIGMFYNLLAFGETSQNIRIRCGTDETIEPRLTAISDLNVIYDPFKDNFHVYRRNLMDDEIHFELFGASTGTPIDLYVLHNGVRQWVTAQSFWIEPHAFLEDQDSPAGRAMDGSIERILGGRVLPLLKPAPGRDRSQATVPGRLPITPLCVPHLQPSFNQSLPLLRSVTTMHPLHGHDYSRETYTLLEPAMLRLADYASLKAPMLQRQETRDSRGSYYTSTPNDTPPTETSDNNSFLPAQDSGEHLPSLQTVTRSIAMNAFNDRMQPSSMPLQPASYPSDQFSRHIDIFQSGDNPFQVYQDRDLVMDDDYNNVLDSFPGQMHARPLDTCGFNFNSSYSQSDHVAASNNYPHGSYHEDYGVLREDFLFGPGPSSTSYNDQRTGSSYAIESSSHAHARYSQNRQSAFMPDIYSPALPSFRPGPPAMSTRRVPVRTSNRDHIARYDHVQNERATHVGKKHQGSVKAYTIGATVELNGEFHEFYVASICSEPYIVIGRSPESTLIKRMELFGRQSVAGLEAMKLKCLNNIAAREAAGQLDLGPRRWVANQGRDHQVGEDD
jgi:hypothetical protein